MRLEEFGIHGNMHEMFLDKNSDEVIKFVDGLLKNMLDRRLFIAGCVARTTPFLDPVSTRRN